MKSAKLDYEILIMDDASNDGTVEIVKKEAEKNKAICLIQREPPYGFGRSIRDAINAARGEACIILMADLSDDPAIIPLMKKKIDEGADMVVGSRFIKGAKIKGYPQDKMLSNRLFNIAVQVGLLSSVTDSSNAFKMFRTSIARQLDLKSNGFEISAEITAKFIIKKAKIIEVPASWAEREGGEAKFKLGKESSRYFGLYLDILKNAYIGK
jgi:dolichol-phosphate mannosyltransferase